MLFFRYRAVNVCPVSVALGGLYFDWCVFRISVVCPCEDGAGELTERRSSVFEPSARSLFKSVFSPRINFFLLSRPTRAPLS